MDPTVIGIIGCGNISDAYLGGAARSQLVRVKSVADIRADAAEARAREHGVQAVPVDTLLADPDIEIVVNLTVPAAHAPVNLQIIEAGKHAYQEKPLATRFAAGKSVMQAAAAKGLASAARRIRSLAPPIRPAATRSTPVRSVFRLPAPLLSCHTAWSIGIRTLDSSTSMAADRSMISDPIM